MENYDYKGWKIPKQLYIYAHKNRNEYKNHPYPQAMIASSNTEKAINTAKRWACGTYRNDGIDESLYTEYIIENNNITLEVIESAQGSSQGGKLSFWNCIISKGDMSVIVGIGSDLLLELLKTSTFIDGECQTKVTMARYGNHWGAIHEKMPEYKEAIKDMDFSNKIISAKKTTKWEPGYEYFSKTMSDIYLYDLYCWYEYDGCEKYWGTPRTYFIKSYSKPKLIKMTFPTEYIKDVSSLKEYIYSDTDNWRKDYLYFPRYNCNNKLPSRIKGEQKIKIDINMNEIEDIIQHKRSQAIKEFIDTKEPDYYSIEKLITYLAMSTSTNQKPIISPDVLQKFKEKGVKFIYE